MAWGAVVAGVVSAAEGIINSVWGSAENQQERKHAEEAQKRAAEIAALNADMQAKLASISADKTKMIFIGITVIVAIAFSGLIIKNMVD